MNSRMWLSMRLWVLLLVVSLPSISFSQIQLSDQAKISLMNCDPGPELYASFGHSALWVYDPVNEINWIYNWGTFNFDPPGFYVEFAAGRLNYFLNRETFRRFDYGYRYRKQGYEELELDLTQAQKQALYEYVENNFLPQNRYYLYDFFFDNCATRIEVVLAEVLGEDLQYPSDSIATSKTFRQLLHENLGNLAWAEFGIDLALGSVVDRVATTSEQAFLPEYLAKNFEEASVFQDSTWVPLVKNRVPLYEAPSPSSPGPWYLHPLAILSLLLLGSIYFTVHDMRTGSISRYWDSLLFFLSGLGGVLLFFLTFFTEHTATASNFNLLWLLPVYVLVPFFGLFRRAGWKLFNLAFWGFSFFLILIVVTGYFWLPQQFPIAALPWMGALMIRCLFRVNALVKGQAS
ncbi:DUF4105 domain-containing protein [Pontibacter sp. G13]|uniref:lipoprotein N-acyltransferase Lnb domain-containing protein n=1 Tax=Pontibacter sp. G13 TaxID=3074898 RepID=UPI0028895750|nr:DUF4105 domain-containing protein [Pontibacter sp. G13]WNJ21386.1 DUF4105 domain-containing protein [Pontibacter sp. G13]